MRVPASDFARGRLGPAFVMVLATGLGGAIALSRLALQPTLGAEAPFVLAWPGILLAAFLGGFWPALLVTLIGLAVGQEALTAAGEPGMGPGAALVFLAFGLVFAIAGGLRKRGLRRAQANAARMSELQAQIVHVARLNAMGELGGALAHELNQPLGAIRNYASAARHLAARDGPASSELAEVLDRIGEQADRAAQIVARVRATVDRGEIEATPQSLPALVQEAVAVASAIAKPDVTIRYDFDRACDVVLADRIQVQQVVLNLVRNALEAMATVPRRELRIASRPAEAGLVEVSVADTGPGVAPELAERLFQPFVTGKPGGMGVGLSISSNIVEAHGGRMWASPNPGGGAIFHFTLASASPI